MADLPGRQPGVPQGPFDRGAQTQQQRRAQLLEPFAGYGPAQLAVAMDEGELVLLGGGQRALGDLGGPAQRRMHGQIAAPRRNSGCAPMSAIKPSMIADTKSSPPRKLSPAVARTSITPSKHLQERDVEGAAAEIENQDAASPPGLVQAVGERRGGRLVEQALDLEPGELAGGAGRLALGVVEIGRHGDDGLA